MLANTCGAVWKERIGVQVVCALRINTSAGVSPLSEGVPKVAQQGYAAITTDSPRGRA